MEFIFNKQLIKLTNVEWVHCSQLGEQAATLWTPHSIPSWLPPNLVGIRTIPYFFGMRVFHIKHILCLTQGNGTLPLTEGADGGVTQFLVQFGTRTPMIWFGTRTFADCCKSPCILMQQHTWRRVSEPCKGMYRTHKHRQCACSDSVSLYGLSFSFMLIFLLFSFLEVFLQAWHECYISFENIQVMSHCII